MKKRLTKIITGPFSIPDPKINKPLITGLIIIPLVLIVFLILGIRSCSSDESVNVWIGSVGTDRITLGWNSVSSSTNYRIYYSTDNHFSHARIAAVTGTTVTGLTSNTTYYFWVAVVQGNQVSNVSSVVSATTANPFANTTTLNTLMNLVFLRGGTFMMGSPSNEPGRNSDEIQHQVTVNSFYMSKYEVTQKEWVTVMGTNPSEFKGENLPVECVNWYEAVEYCNIRSQKEGLTSAYVINNENVT